MDDDALYNRCGDSVGLLRANAADFAESPCLQGIMEGAALELERLRAIVQYVETFHPNCLPCDEEMGFAVEPVVRAAEWDSNCDEASEYGTLEGILSSLSERSAGLEIRIQDPLWARAIPCRVSDDQIEDAVGAFRKRVEVTGLIHYNRLGRPTSIRMESLTVLPDDKELPSAAEIRGLFVDCQDAWKDE